MFTLLQAHDDQSEVYKYKKHPLKFLEPCEKSAKPFESAKKALDLAAAPIHEPIARLGIDAFFLGRDDGNAAQIKRQRLEPVHTIE
jgi:hypothetical protein